MSPPQVKSGDRVRIKDGTFAGLVGRITQVQEATGKVRVELTIRGQPVPVELENSGVEVV